MKIQKEFIIPGFGLVQQNMPTLSKAHGRGLGEYEGSFGRRSVRRVASPTWRNDLFDTGQPRPLPGVFMSQNSSLSGPLGSVESRGRS